MLVITIIIRANFITLAIIIIIVDITGSEKAYDGPNTTLQASYFWTSNYELKPTYREYCTWFIFDLPRKPPAAAMKSSLSVYCYEN